MQREGNEYITNNRKILNIIRAMSGKTEKKEKQMRRMEKKVSRPMNEEKK